MGLGRAEITPAEDYYLGKTKTKPEVKKFKTSTTFEELTRGSSNWLPVRAAVALIAGGEDAKRGMEALTWWYAAEADPNGIGQCGAEGPQSSTYFHAHEWAAIVAALHDVPGAVAHVERSLAYATICATPDGQIVTCGARCKADSPWERESRWKWLAHLLILPYEWGSKEQSHDNEHATRLLRAKAIAAGGLGLYEPLTFDCTEWLRGERQKNFSRLKDALDTFVVGPAPVTVRHYEGGHISFYESGPQCYDNPAPCAAYHRDGNRVEIANPRVDLDFKGEEFKPGELIEVGLGNGGLTCFLRGKGWAHVINFPPGRLLYEFKLRGLGEQGAGTPAVPPTKPSDPSPSAKPAPTTGGKVNHDRERLLEIATDLDNKQFRKKGYPQDLRAIAGRMG